MDHILSDHIHFSSYILLFLLFFPIASQATKQEEAVCNIFKFTPNLRFNLTKISG